MKKEKTRHILKIYLFQQLTYKYIFYLQPYFKLNNQVTLLRYRICSATKLTQHPIHNKNAVNNESYKLLLKKQYGKYRGDPQPNWSKVIFCAILFRVLALVTNLHFYNQVANCIELCTNSISHIRILVNACCETTLHLN